jgi:hypothetical protein
MDESEESIIGGCRLFDKKYIDIVKASAERAGKSFAILVCPWLREVD